GLWVMIAFDSVEAKEKFLLSTGVCKTHWVRAIEIPGWTLNLDDQNDEESDSEDKECEEVFKKDFSESDEEVQGENDVSRVFDTEVEKENPKAKDGVVSSEQN
ncbi:hypothetical protein Tco_0376539, partial [Tanacetum coccineum]